MYTQPSSGLKSHDHNCAYPLYNDAGNVAFAPISCQVAPLSVEAQIPVQMTFPKPRLTMACRYIVCPTTSTSEGITVLIPPWFHGGLSCTYDHNCCASAGFAAPA